MPSPNDRAPRIVVGVDGSAPAQAALRWAVGQAELTGAAVDAVIAWEFPIALGRFGSARGAPHDDAEFRELAERTITEAIGAVAGLASLVQVRAHAREGNATGVLLDAADEADMLVVGNRGTGSFAQALLGSVSLYCVHFARCPVVVIRA